MKTKDSPIPPEEEIPLDYPVCIHAHCPLADRCLHQLTYRRHDTLGTYLKLLNPTQCTTQSDCPFYADASPIRFAQGFTHFKEKMYPQQYRKFMDTLILHFGRNPYYKRKKGALLLPPHEQEQIRKVLQQVGADATMEFDHYVETICWYP